MSFHLRFWESTERRHGRQWVRLMKRTYGSTKVDHVALLAKLEAKWAREERRGKVDRSIT